jgi:hypothetical protein
VLSPGDLLQCSGLCGFVGEESDSESGVLIDSSAELDFFLLSDLKLRANVARIPCIFTFAFKCVDS